MCDHDGWIIESFKNKFASLIDLNSLEKFVENDNNQKNNYSRIYNWLSWTHDVLKLMMWPGRMYQRNTCSKTKDPEGAVHWMYSMRGWIRQCMELQADCDDEQK